MSNSNLHEAAKSAPPANKYSSANERSSTYYDNGNYRSQTSAQERAAIKLNNYLANNQCYYDSGAQNSSRTANLASNNNLTTYSSAYLEPELKSQLLSAQQQTQPQSSSVLVQNPSYYNARSKSVSEFFWLSQLFNYLSRFLNFFSIFFKMFFLSKKKYF